MQFVEMVAYIVVVPNAHYYCRPETASRIDATARVRSLSRKHLFSYLTEELG